MRCEYPMTKLKTGFTTYWVLFLFLVSCASLETKIYKDDECGYKWELVNDPIDESKWRYTYTDDIQLLCGNMEHAEACSIRREATWNTPKEFEIILPEKKERPGGFCKSDEYYKQHEERHGKGWVHPSNQLK